MSKFTRTFISRAPLRIVCALYSEPSRPQLSNQRFVLGHGLELFTFGAKLVGVDKGDEYGTDLW